jgi:hypothetical protein
MGFLALLLGGTVVGWAADQRMSETEKPHKIELTNLENFDDLDFNVYSGQKWDQLGRSHAKDIVVHWPDGRTTRGIEPHKG